MEKKKSSTSQASVDLIDSDFMRITREEMLAVNSLPVDIFLKISDSKLVIIGRKGSKSIDDLHVLENEKVSEFYVRKSSYRECVGQNLTIAGVVLSKSEISDPTKTEFLTRTAVSVFNEIEAVGFNHESFEHAKIISKSIQTLVATKSDIHSVLSMMSMVSDDLLRHSMAVSAVSVMIARSMGWTVQATLEKISLGGLLHDIGMKELAPELISRPRFELTFEEQQIYETHVSRGVEILSTMPSIPEDILAMTLEHHENSIGQGYPRRIRDFKMNPLAKVIAIADVFCELTIKNINHPQPKSAVDALAYIETTLGQPFSKPVFIGLKQALNKISAPQNGSVRVA
jgi:putative nucleotidyltransferase with HDIG domain